MTVRSKALTFSLTLCFLPAFAAKAQETAPAEDEAATRREDEVRRTVLKTFRDEIQDAQDKFADLKKKAARLSEEFQNALTNDAGKRIARDPLAVMTFIQLRDEQPPPLQQVARKAAAIDAILKTVDGKLGRPRVGDLPSAQQRRDVLDAYSWAKANADRIGDRLDSLQALLATTAGNDDVSKVPTLDAAIKQYKNRFARFFAEGWQIGEDKAAGPAQKTLSDTAEKAFLDRATLEARLKMEKALAELERMKAEHEAELRQLREQQEKRLADLERELALAKGARLKQQAETTVITKQAQQDADLILKRKRIHDPDVQRLLAPFTTAGYWQPAMRQEMTIDKKPMSWSKLKEFGAIEETPEGLQRLLAAGTHPYWTHQADKIRPRWNYPVLLKDCSTEQRDDLRKAQKLLIELGEVLVEQGMLTP